MAATWSADASASARSGTPAAALVRVLAGARRVYLPTLLLAAFTGWVVAVAVVHLAHHGNLGAVLSGGRAELLAPGLIALLVAAFVCERRWPAEPRDALARGHVQDATFLILYAAIAVPMMTLLGVGFATLFGAHLGWLEVSWTAGWPTWLVVGVTLVAMDGANWIAHYADHRLEPLWRLHAVHHSQEELSVLTSFRAHPLMHTTGFLLATVPVLVLMGDRSIAPVLITAYVCLGTLPHANVRWTFGPLGRVVVSPAYHRLHHSSADVQGQNLAIVLTVWDVLAGRAQFPARRGPVCRTGLAGRPLAVEQAADRARPFAYIASQLIAPFAARRPPSLAPRPQTRDRKPAAASPRPQTRGRKPAVILT